MRRRASLAALVALGTAHLATGCVDDVYVCTVDDQCVTGSATGRCEASGFCSYPDQSRCPGSGWRYGSHAGDGLADTCVGSSGGDAGGFVNDELPVISGELTVGSTIEVSEGVWTPTPDSFQFAWHRCDQAGSGCTRSPTTMDQPTYLLESGDVGYRLRAQVAPEGDWPSGVDSEPTAVVQP